MVMAAQIRMSDKGNVMQYISSLIEDTIIETLASLYSADRNNIEILNCKQTKFHNFSRIHIVYEGFSQWECMGKSIVCWFQLIQSNKDKFGRYHWTFDTAPYLPYNVSKDENIKEYRNVDVHVKSTIVDNSSKDTI